ncbi:ATP-binding protein [Methylococcus geothermalis]|uniref:histidine kinase n=1 Tax=Methylococcus geothermalis TaxID=2681310 RepID=A0A858Q9D9_9GAMM|nr:ATP-binding protein [Methylococcus geothermalis]QJD30306.1 two-component sensor histidine kinase [Methylococcus geothermalis]
MRSIRRRLIAALLGTIAVATGIGAYATFSAARFEVGALLDYQLRQFALSLGDQAYPPPVRQDRDDLDLVVQVWSPEGVQLYYSHPHRTLPGLVGTGYATVETREGAWRVFATPLGRRVIQVAQPMSVRNKLALEAASRVLMPFVVLLPVLSLAIWVIVGRGLAPLRRLARAVAARTPQSLEPLSETPIPEEALPLVRSLNDLLARLSEALAAQRAFIADAAHELRTPIAAMQLQADLAEHAETADERSAAMEDLKAGVRRAGRAVQQLLTLARQEPDAVSVPLTRVVLADIARQVVAEHAGLAARKSIDFGFAEVDADLSVTGDPGALRTLLANLVDNAVHYTPRGGVVDVSVRRAEDGRPCLEVVDTGPGIPAAERNRVFDRFYRGAETPEPGTGLGLAIVRAIADRHGACITLGEGEKKGLRVRVAFPAQHPPERRRP